jgi:hypothetical protein
MIRVEMSVEPSIDHVIRASQYNVFQPIKGGQVHFNAHVGSRCSVQTVDERINNTARQKLEDLICATV